MNNVPKLFFEDILLECVRQAKLLCSVELNIKKGIEYYETGLHAGWAYPAFGKIRGFSLDDIDRVGISLEIAKIDAYYVAREVIPHEVAHLVMAHLDHNYNSHDDTWKAIAKSLGAKEAHIHHPFKLSRARRSRQFEYKTSHGAIAWLGEVMHNRLKNKHKTRLVGDERINIANWTGKTRDLV